MENRGRRRSPGSPIEGRLHWSQHDEWRSPSEGTFRIPFRQIGLWHPSGAPFGTRTFRDTHLSGRTFRGDVAAYAVEADWGTASRFVLGGSPPRVLFTQLLSDPSPRVLFSRSFPTVIPSDPLRGYFGEPRHGCFHATTLPWLPRRIHDHHSHKNGGRIRPPFAKDYNSSRISSTSSFAPCGSSAGCPAECLCPEGRTRWHAGLDRLGGEGSRGCQPGEAGRIPPFPERVPAELR
jgi:hypothetical protein